MRRTTGLVAIPLACAALAIAGCGSSGDQDTAKDTKADAAGKTYTVATTVPFPPYTDLVDGKFVGFEKDLITAAANANGFRIKIENVPKFESLIPGMLSGRYDAAYDAFVDNPARHRQFKTIDWSASQWELAAPKGKFSANTDACGKRVAVQAGSQPMIDALERFAKESCDGRGIKQVPLPLGQQPSAVKSGRADLMVTDSISMPGVLKKTPAFARVGEPYGKPEIGGLLVPASRSEFVDATVAGLKKIVADGTYDKIMAKWDITNAAYDKATVNVAQ